MNRDRYGTPYAANHSDGICLHCGAPIERVCGLWGHVELTDFLKNPHIPEPKDGAP